MKRVVTYLMAGGKGERLLPLTKDRTKPAVPFGGIYRIIDFTLNNCINSGLRRIYILTQYKSASLQRHIRLGWNILPSELGQFIEILPAQQRVGESWYLGTADAIFQNIYSVENEKADEVLILAGDHVYKMNYYKMIDYHRSIGADMTLAVVEMDKSKASDVGVVEVDKQGKVKGFQEKPGADATLIPGSKDKIYASMGIYLFNTSILEEELIEDNKNSDSKHDFGKDILPDMVKKGRKVVMYDFKGDDQRPAYWRDIGTRDAYYEANMDLISENPEFDLYDEEWPIRTYQEQFPPAKVIFSENLAASKAAPEALCREGVFNSLIANGCVINGSKIVHSILSPDVRVEKNSQVYDSILMEGVRVGEGVKIKGAIIDKDIQIPQGAVIGYDAALDKERFHVTHSGIVLVAKGTGIK
ncbi:MAG: glucose-1-phosphate adenylyltransferase [Candidatus Omnitrophica bacterium]|nr:glucose-1-phosphate adenylyltransferase [Candidatus Omnitrophota bacterium]MDD5654730.1 glucose-1-phosphate adenylyltransferase [Candidatus Omnitrophota bacterium]